MNLKKENTILMTLLIMLFLVAMAMTFTSCKSKKKITEREKTEEVVTKVEKVNTVTVNDVLKETVAVNTLEELFLSKNDKIQLTQADPEKTITLTDHHGRTTTITGANATISQEEKKEEREATSTVNTSEVDKTIWTENVQINESSKKKTNSRTSDSETSGISSMIGLGIGIVVSLLLIWLFARFTKKRV